MYVPVREKMAREFASHVVEFAADLHRGGVEVDGGAEGGTARSASHRAAKGGGSSEAALTGAGKVGPTGGKSGSSRSPELMSSLGSFVFGGDFPDGAELEFVPRLVSQVNIVAPGEEAFPREEERKKTSEEQVVERSPPVKQLQLRNLEQVERERQEKVVNSKFEKVEDVGNVLEQAAAVLEKTNFQREKTVEDWSPRAEPADVDQLEHPVAPQEAVVERGPLAAQQEDSTEGPPVRQTEYQGFFGGQGINGDRDSQASSDEQHPPGPKIVFSVDNNKKTSGRDSSEEEDEDDVPINRFKGIRDTRAVHLHKQISADNA